MGFFDDRREKSNERKVEIFKYMIQFLEIYGNENFGESTEIDWSRVWEYCSACDMLDFNYEVEDLVYNTKDEEFRDKVFAFVEKQAIEGYPLWRLFKMSKWLYDKCEADLEAAEHAKDVEYFNNTKCYRCKNFKNSLHIVYSTPLEPILMGNFDSVGDFRQQYPDARVKSYSHNMICLEREKQLHEAYEKACEKDSFLRHHFEEQEFKQNYKFKYKKFNYRDESQDDSSKDWVLYPLALKRCNYFIESDMTPEKFEKLWNEIPRRDNGN